MTTLERSRNSYLGHLTRVHTELSNLIPKKMCDIVDAQIEVALVQLSVKWTNFENVSKSVEEALDQEDPNYSDNYIRHIDELEGRRDETLKWQVAGERVRREWQSVKDAVRAEALEQAKPKPVINVSVEPPAVTVNTTTNERARSPTRRMPIKLKEISLPEFSGNRLEWFPFWDMFKANIHKNRELSDVQKFTYLRQQLKGEALATVGTFQVTAANYDAAIALLKKRFGDKQTIIDAHMLQLDSIPACRNINDVSQIRHFQLTISQNINSLEALNVFKDGYGSLLSTRLLRKIPEQLQKKWFEDPTNKSTDLDAFLKFLEDQVEALERFSRLKLSDDGQKQVKTQKEHTTSPQISSTSALLAGANHQHNTQDGATTSFQSTVFASHSPCPFGCTSVHYPSRCPLPLETRRRALTERKACFKCLRPGHEAKACTSRTMGPCPRCKGLHHSAVCTVPFIPTVAATPSPPVPTPPTTPATTSPFAAAIVAKPAPKASTIIVAADDDSKFALNEPSDPPSILQTATVWVNGPGRRTKCRSLMDNCANYTFITKRIADAIGLEICGQEELAIGGFGGNRTSGLFNYTKGIVYGVHKRHQIPFKAYITEKICNPIHQTTTGQWVEELQQRGMLLADNSSTTDDIDLLIGVDTYWKIVTGRVHLLQNGPMAVDSLFGWLLSGQVIETGVHNSNNSIVMLSTSEYVNNETVYEELQQMIDVESIEADQRVSSAPSGPEGELALFEESLEYTGKGYKVRLLWKNPRPELPSNEGPVKRQLSRLVQSLEKTPGLLERYDNGLQELIDRGWVKEIPVESWGSQPAHYLSHHPVIKEERVTTKMRIVFNASGKTKGFNSLNDCLITGQNLTPQLAAILLRFRMHRIAFTADMEKAFYQITLHEQDRDFLRFFWIDLKTRKIRLFHWCVIAFGMSTSPFFLAATLRHHLSKTRTPGTVNELLKKNIYVDDFIAGADTVEEAQEMMRDAQSILLEAGFPLRKWATNSAELEALIPEQCTNENLILSEGQPTKVLGLVWDKKNDWFTFAARPLLEICSAVDRMDSMRLLLIAYSRIFDPLGFISPFIVRARILCQELWKKKAKWDQPLPEDIAVPWKKWVEDLPRLSSVSVPRFFFPGSSSHTDIQLHIFCDASEKAYGATAYIRSMDQDGFLNVQFVSSKAKVAPLKVQTIPRLELEAARTGVKLADYIMEAIGSSGNLQILYWSDSMVTLGWIRGEPHRWKTFVAHRVQLIHLKSNPKDWRHVPGSENPADLCSRGCSAETLLSSSLWWQGPSFLKEDQSSWPGEPEDLYNLHNNDDLMKEARCFLINKSDPPTPVIQLKRFSIWNRAVRAVAYATRFISIYRNPRDHLVGDLTAAEVQAAKIEIVRAVQRECFPTEFTILKERKQRLPENSRLNGLRPYFDEKDGIIRLQRRTELSEEEGVNLAVLPSKHWLLNLIIWDVHKKLNHAGVSQTITEIRQTFWIPKGRQAVRDILSKCVPCRRLHGSCVRQPIAPLPTVRCSRSLAFEAVGIDFAGPLFVKERTGEPSKAYICLITCSSTRAIHLELVSSLSTEDFLLAFRRFISQRGLCRIVYSDNAKTFKKASSLLSQLWKNLNSTEVRSFFSNTGIEWRFICERAPWWGGFYESLVKSVKTPLKKIIGHALLNHDEMETTLKEIEATINSRPLTYEYNDLDEPQPITPSHFIIGKRLALLPPLTTESIIDPDPTPEQLVNRARYRERLLNGYWIKWSGEYLQQLSNRVSKNPLNQCNIRTGAVVVIKEDNTPRHKWRLGVIHQVFTGRDKIIRSVQLRTERGLINRAVEFIFPLEVTSEADDIAPQPSEVHIDYNNITPQPEEVQSEVDSTDQDLHQPPLESGDRQPEEGDPGGREDVRTRTGRIVRLPNSLRDFVL